MSGRSRGALLLILLVLSVAACVATPSGTAPLPGASTTGDPSTPAPPTGPVCRLLLLAGQSNMAGQGRLSELTPDARQLPTNVRLFDGAPGGETFGPEIAIGRELGARYPDDLFVLVKHAVDGSSLLDWAPDWDAGRAALTGNPQLGPLYPVLLDRAAAARGVVAGDCRPSAVFWMQGERDALFAVAARDYGTNLEALIRSLRADLGMPDLPFILGQVNPPAGRYPEADTVRAAQAEAARTIPHVVLVPTEGLSTRADGLHFDTVGQLELGRRFAGAYLDVAPPAGP